MQWKPNVSVAAIIEKDQKFLVVEETANDGPPVFNQPAGHLEFGETLIEAVQREVLEETAWHFVPDGLVGLYLYTQPGTDMTYLRVCFHGRPLEDTQRPLDVGILRAMWLSYAELADLGARHRTPLVMRCLNDYLAGRHYPLELLTHFPWNM
jgi:8-oxo-dGTP pyrophosphatase MutT (NUDIX family)